MSTALRHYPNLIQPSMIPLHVIIHGDKVLVTSVAEAEPGQPHVEGGHVIVQVTRAEVKVAGRLHVHGQLVDVAEADGRLGREKDRTSRLETEENG